MSTASAYGGKRSRSSVQGKRNPDQLVIGGLPVVAAGYDPDAWSTPWPLFKSWDAEFNFTLDACADATNHKCELYFDKEADGLKQSWAGHRVFANVPYSETERWIEKAAHEVENGCELAFLVFKADTSTKWWHRWWPQFLAMLMLFPDAIRWLWRVQFDPPPGYDGETGSPNMGHVVVVFRPSNPRNQVLEITSKFIQCCDCQRAFTIDPAAAGWFDHGKRYGDDDSRWDCVKCWREQFDTYGDRDYSKKNKVTLELGLWDQMTATLTLKQVQDRIKTADKSEIKFWKNIEKLIKERAGKSSYTMGQSTRDLAEIAIIKREVGFKPFGPLPETVKI
jgi:phage N-6-adenine-methyltransferase